MPANPSTAAPTRPVRISLAVGVASLLGLADLALTMHFMHTTGMSELNPLARFLIDASPTALVSFKLLSLLISGSILVKLRARRVAELGAWASVAMMIALTVHWNHYVHSTHELTSLEPAVLASDPTFVKIGG